MGRILLQRGRDSNPRYPCGVYTLSRRAPSTTRTPLYNRVQRCFFFCWDASLKAVNTSSSLVFAICLKMFWCRFLMKRKDFSGPVF